MFKVPKFTLEQISSIIGTKQHSDRASNAGQTHIIVDNKLENERNKEL